MRRLSSSSLILFTFAIAACKGAPSAPAATPAATPPAPAPPTPKEAAARVNPAPMTLAQSGIVPEWLDRKADPCTDFYAFACGGFMATAQIPPDRSSWSAITVVVQQTEDFLRDVLEKAAKSDGKDPVQKVLGDHYAACMDEAAIEKAGISGLQPFMAEIAKVKDLPSAAHAVLTLHQIGAAPFFYVGPSQDFADATQVIAAFDQAGLGLPDRDYYLQDKGNMKKVRDAYREHVTRTFVLTGASAADARAAAADVLRIETALAKLQQDKVTRRDPHKTYHRIERAGLEKAAPKYPWGEYLTGMGMADVTAITVSDPKYFGAMTALVAKEKPLALQHYLTWTLLDAVAPYLSKAFVEENFTLEQALAGTKALPPRWRRCVRRADEDLGELLAQPYVAVKFAGDAKTRAVELTHAVLAAMAEELGELTWMDDATRVAAKKKLGTMEYLVGFPDKWRVYDFKVSRTDYLANTLAATRFELGRQLKKIGKPVDRLDWGMTPPTVNAYYDPSLNELALPAGQLQPPFFGATFHPAVNFGSTAGGTIGHEMTHGFDDSGSQFDEAGNLRDWWSKSTSKAFGDATRCVVDQYAQYEAVPGVKLNGKLTSGENIADIGGVKIAYRAYHAWRAAQKNPPPAEVEGLTDDQLYFLAYGQSWCAKINPESLETMAHTNPHSPPKWRVNGVVVDQPGFADAYKCAKNAPMNPEKKCAVW
jgi:predicted metalloendopeptidase